MTPIGYTPREDAPRFGEGNVSETDPVYTPFWSARNKCRWHLVTRAKTRKRVLIKCYKRERVQT